MAGYVRDRSRSSGEHSLMVLMRHIGLRLFVQYAIGIISERYALSSPATYDCEAPVLPLRAQTLHSVDAATTTVVVPVFTPISAG